MNLFHFPVEKLVITYSILIVCYAEIHLICPTGQNQHIVTLEKTHLSQQKQTEKQSEPSTITMSWITGGSESPGARKMLSDCIMSLSTLTLLDFSDSHKSRLLPRFLCSQSQLLRTVATSLIIESAILL